jgi:hypothetical protein
MNEQPNSTKSSVELKRVDPSLVRKSSITIKPELKWDIESFDQEKASKSLSILGEGLENTEPIDENVRMGET